jgi:opacity protein-like surface antigen
VTKTRWLTGVAIAVLAIAAPAFAADLPYKAPPPATAAAWDWSGFYIGGHAGYGWGQDPLTDINDNLFDIPSLGFSGFKANGFLGGLHAGANWQSGKIVVGLEADLSSTNIKGSSTNTASLTLPGTLLSGTAAFSGAFDLLGTDRVRLGYLVTPNVLVYGTGGPAWTRFVQNSNATVNAINTAPPGTSSISDSASTPGWRFGWVAGLGAEARLPDTHWIARLEYLRYAFGSEGSDTITLNGLSSQTFGDLTVNVVRAGLSYKFDPDGSVAGSTSASPGAPLYTKTPPRVTVPWTWSGFYLGAHAGYGQASDPFNGNFILNVPISGFDSHGFVGGFQAGANWQSGAIVGGLEIDLSGTRVKGSTSNAFAFPPVSEQATQIDTFDRFGSARARLGYLATPSVLLYATGGPAWTRLVVEQDAFVMQTPPFSNFTTSSVTPTWQFGWVAGAGAEARLGDTNWLARLEYLHYDFGPGRFLEDSIVGAPGTLSTSGHRTADVVRTGLGYKFDWPGYSSGGPSVMPVKAAAATAWSWSGFYLGGHAGYGWGRDPFDDLINGASATVAPVFLTGIKSQGFVGGFQAGANWQAGKVVGGLEIDLSSAPIKGSSSVATGVNLVGTPFTATLTDKFDWLGSARARLGYLVSPNVMLYGTGGLGWTQVDQTATVVLPAETSINTVPSWRVGWVAGAGAEARLCNTNWLVRLEYLHYDFGNSGSVFSDSTTNGVVTLLSNSSTSQHLTTDVVRTGISYKLN